ncbi:MAG: cbb3-type cytochrome c oxidase subunit 3 [Alteromonadaceae bacterium]|nr:cbb3-type cytochrome c oxidase subunit 3 [Alteromonadaceae bacterium]
MDYGTLRGLITLLIFALFIIIVIWSYSKTRKSSFDEAANSIFDSDNQCDSDSKINNADVTSHIEDKKIKTNEQETNNNV